MIILPWNLGPLVFHIQLPCFDILLLLKVDGIINLGPNSRAMNHDSY